MSAELKNKMPKHLGLKTQSSALSPQYFFVAPSSAPITRYQDNLGTKG